MQSLYAYFNNKEVNLSDVRQQVFDNLILEPDFYNAQPQEKLGYKELLPVLLDEAFEQKLEMSELPENQKWLGQLAEKTVSAWHKENLAVKKRIHEELKLDLVQQNATEIFFWQILLGLIHRVEDAEDRRQTRHLDRETSPVHELKILKHPHVELLQQSLHPEKGSQPMGLKVLENDEKLRLFQYIFKELPEYQTYKEKKETNPTEDEEIMKVLYRKLFRSEIFNEIMLERDMHWSENRILLEVRLKQTFKTLCNGEVPVFETNQEELQEYTHFFETLFASTMENFEGDENLIRKAVTNWDPDRIALLDKYIIHLSLNEMRNFPHIPVKVTINEYLEIAKAYSTPGSSGFINGVVDKLAKQMKEGGNIKKSARGLMDNR